MSVSFFQSQIVAAPSLPTASWLGRTGLNATVYAVPTVGRVSHGPENTRRLVVKFQTWTHLSLPVEARCSPSEWNATLVAEPGLAPSTPCVFSIRNSTSPVRLFQTLSVPSMPALAIRSPSALNDRLVTGTTF